jgi:hypothetical protein
MVSAGFPLLHWVDAGRAAAVVVLVAAEGAWVASRVTGGARQPALPSNQSATEPHKANRLMFIAFLRLDAVRFNSTPAAVRAQ